MLRMLTLILAQTLLMSCQSAALSAKVSEVVAPVGKGPRVDEGVRANQNQWLKGLVLDPDQTGVTTLAILGDSYSDTGNLFQRTQSLGPPQIYWRSRFSNGPIWVDYVEGATRWAIRNYTFADAEEGQAMTHIPTTALKAQVDRLQKEIRAANRGDVLVSVWIGPDLYREKTDVSAVIQELRTAILALDGFGFHRIAVGNLPDLSQMPLALNAQIAPAQKDFWKKVALEHNEALKNLLEALKKERLDLRAYIFQTWEMQKTSREKAESAGVRLKQEACYKGDARGHFEGERRFCKHAGTMQYWDFTHPSSKLHCFYAAQFLSDAADAEHVGGYNKGQAVDHCQQL